MKWILNWLFFVSKIIDNGSDLLELFKHVTTVRCLSRSVLATNRKSHTSFQLLPVSMILNDRNGLDTHNFTCTSRFPESAAYVRLYPINTRASEHFVGGRWVSCFTKKRLVNKNQLKKWLLQDLRVIQYYVKWCWLGIVRLGAPIAGGIYMVRLKNAHRQKLQFLRTRWTFYYEILYVYFQGLTALLLHI